MNSRFKEHCRDYNSLQKKSGVTDNPNSLSAMAKHCFHSHHKFNDVVTTPLHFCGKGRRRDRLEEYYTLKYLESTKNTCNNVLNDTESIQYK